MGCDGDCKHYLRLPDGNHCSAEPVCPELARRYKEALEAIVYRRPPSFDVRLHEAHTIARAALGLVP